MTTRLLYTCISSKLNAAWAEQMRSMYVDGLQVEAWLHVRIYTAGKRCASEGERQEPAPQAGPCLQQRRLAFPSKGNVA